jgi:hypothetical protein
MGGPHDGKRKEKWVGNGKKIIPSEKQEHEDNRTESREDVFIY